MGRHAGAEEFLHFLTAVQCRFFFKEFLNKVFFITCSGFSLLSFCYIYGKI